MIALRHLLDLLELCDRFPLHQRHAASANNCMDVTYVCGRALSFIKEALFAARPAPAATHSIEAETDTPVRFGNVCVETSITEGWKPEGWKHPRGSGVVYADDA